MCENEYIILENCDILLKMWVETVEKVTKRKKRTKTNSNIFTFVVIYDKIELSKTEKHSKITKNKKGVTQ